MSIALWVNCGIMHRKEGLTMIQRKGALCAASASALAALGGLYGLYRYAFYSPRDAQNDDYHISTNAQMQVYRDEITRAMKKLAADCAAGKQDPEEITEQVVASYLDTAGMPDPDLLIRTSGEIRLSNYLLWQLAYTEIYVTDCLWPDFDQEELEKAIMAYNRRDRRYGGVKQA